jgi:hypothetical protein
MFLHFVASFRHPVMPPKVSALPREAIEDKLEQTGIMVQDIRAMLRSDERLERIQLSFVSEIHWTILVLVSFTPSAKNR